MFTAQLLSVNNWIRDDMFTTQLSVDNCPLINMTDLNLIIAIVGVKIIAHLTYTDICRLALAARNYQWLLTDQILWASLSPAATDLCMAHHMYDRRRFSRLISFDHGRMTVHLESANIIQVLEVTSHYQVPNVELSVVVATSQQIFIPLAKGWFKHEVTTPIIKLYRADWLWHRRYTASVDHHGFEYQLLTSVDIVGLELHYQTSTGHLAQLTCRYHNQRRCVTVTVLIDQRQRIIDFNQLVERHGQILCWLRVLIDMDGIIWYREDNGPNYIRSSVANARRVMLTNTGLTVLFNDGQVLTGYHNSMLTNISAVLAQITNHRPSLTVGCNRVDSSASLTSDQDNYSDGSSSLTSNYSDSSAPLLTSNRSDSSAPLLTSNRSDSSAPLLTSNRSNSSAPSLTSNHFDTSPLLTSDHSDSSAPSLTSAQDNHSDISVPRLINSRNAQPFYQRSNYTVTITDGGSDHEWYTRQLDQLPPVIDLIPTSSFLRGFMYLDWYYQVHLVGVSPDRLSEKLPGTNDHRLGAIVMSTTVHGCQPLFLE